MEQLFLEIAGQAPIAAIMGIFGWAVLKHLDKMEQRAEAERARWGETITGLSKANTENQRAITDNVGSLADECHNAHAKVVKQVTDCIDKNSEVIEKNTAMMGTATELMRRTERALNS